MRSKILGTVAAIAIISANFADAALNNFATIAGAQDVQFFGGPLSDVYVIPPQEQRKLNRMFREIKGADPNEYEQLLADFRDEGITLLREIGGALVPAPLAAAPQTDPAQAQRIAELEARVAEFPAILSEQEQIFNADAERQLADKNKEIEELKKRCEIADQARLDADVRAARLQDRINDLEDAQKKEEEKKAEHSYSSSSPSYESSCCPPPASSDFETQRDALYHEVAAARANIAAEDGWSDELAQYLISFGSSLHDPEEVSSVADLETKRKEFQGLLVKREKDKQKALEEKKEEAFSSTSPSRSNLTAAGIASRTEALGRLGYEEEQENMYLPYKREEQHRYEKERNEANALFFRTRADNMEKRIRLITTQREALQNFPGSDSELEVLIQQQKAELEAMRSSDDQQEAELFENTTGLY